MNQQLHKPALKSDDEGGPRNATSAAGKPGRKRECQLMGLTWLLAQNRTRYLHTAALILRAFMMAPRPPPQQQLTDHDGGDVCPTSCSVPGAGDNDDDIPLPVDSKYWSGAARLVIMKDRSTQPLYIAIISLTFCSFHHLLFLF